MKRNISDEVDFEVSGHVARDVGPDDRLAAAAVVEPGDLVRRDRGRIGDGRKMPGSAGIHIRVDGRKIDFVGARRESVITSNSLGVESPTERYLKTLDPEPPVRLSAPNPPTIKSDPLPPLIMSTPDPPNSRSLPLSPNM